MPSPSRPCILGGRDKGRLRPPLSPSLLKRSSDPGLQCLLYSCDLHVSSPELSPQLQTHAPKMVLAQMEFLIFSPIIPLSIFSARRMPPQSLRNLALSSGTPTLNDPIYAFLISSLNYGVPLVLLSLCRHSSPLTCFLQWTDTSLPCLLLTVPFSPLQLTTKHWFHALDYIEPIDIHWGMASNEWKKYLQGHS